jgi:hypothetical protein
MFYHGILWFQTVMMKPKTLRIFWILVEMRLMNQKTLGCRSSWFFIIQFFQEHKRWLWSSSKFETTITIFAFIILCTFVLHIFFELGMVERKHTKKWTPPFAFHLFARLPWIQERELRNFNLVPFCSCFGNKKCSDLKYTKPKSKIKFKLVIARSTKTYLKAQKQLFPSHNVVRAK